MEAITSPASQERHRAAWRQRPWISDLVLAVLVAAIGAISRPTLSFATPEQMAHSIVVFGCSAALAFRHHRTRLVLTLIGTLLLVHLIVVQELTVFAGAVCLVAAYTTQTQLHPPWRWGYVVAIYVGTGIAVLSSPTPTSDTGWMIKAVLAAAAAALITVAVLAGIVRRNRKARYEDALERAAFLEARHEAERRLAAVEERTRIAREMHDVLGHSLNTIAVQAEGARHVIHTDPDCTDQALAAIGRLSRTAVDDVRDLINVLAADDDAEAPTRPTPALRDVGTLISELQHIRAPIRLHVDGDLATVPNQVGLAGYRIVQESITNVLKHADGAAASVRIVVHDRAVDLTILNTSTGQSQTTRRDGSHQGVIGMQERARALGGTLTAGPDPNTGGWRVAASLPWRQP